MANDYLPIDLSKSRAPQLRQGVDLLTMARDRIADVNATVNHMTDGASFTTIEALYGLPPGSGANFASLLQGTTDALNAAIIAEFLARLG